MAASLKLESSAADAAGGSGAAGDGTAEDADESLFDLESLVEINEIRIGKHKVGVRPMSGQGWRWLTALKQAGKTERSAEMFEIAESLLDGATDEEKKRLTAKQVGMILRISATGISAVEALAKEIAEKNASGPDVPQVPTLTASTPLV
jgi:hypothetical protein